MSRSNHAKTRLGCPDATSWRRRVRVGPGSFAFLFLGPSAKSGGGSAMVGGCVRWSRRKFIESRLGCAALPPPVRSGQEEPAKERSLHRDELRPTSQKRKKHMLITSSDLSSRSLPAYSPTPTHARAPRPELARPLSHFSPPPCRGCEQPPPQTIAPVWTFTSIQPSRHLWLAASRRAHPAPPSSLLGVRSPTRRAFRGIIARHVPNAFRSIREVDDDNERLRQHLLAQSAIRTSSIGLMHSNVSNTL